MERVIILSAIFLTSLITMGQSKDSLIIQAKTKHLVDSTQLISNLEDSSFKEMKDIKGKSVYLKSTNKNNHSGTSKAYGYQHSNAVFRRKNHSL